MTFLLLLFLPFLLVQLRRTLTCTGQVKFLQQNTIVINLLRKVEEFDFQTSLRSNPRLKELITSFRNPCDPFEFDYTCKLALGDWATIVFTFVLFARNHTSNHTIPMTEDTLLPSKTEVLLLIKHKVSHKVEDASGDLWCAPAIVMLRGRSRHWEETVCHWASHWSSGYMSLCWFPVAVKPWLYALWGRVWAGDSCPLRLIHSVKLVFQKARALWQNTDTCTVDSAVTMTKLYWKWTSKCK